MEREMSQLTKDDIPKLRNIPVVTSDGEEIGHVGDAYYDESSERLECVGVAADAIGFSKRMIPVGGAMIDAEGKLRLPYTRAQIEGAPDWDDDEDDRWEETSGYYGGVADEDRAVTRSEEELHVEKERVHTGDAKLRKWVETEHVERDVPLQRESAHVVREPIDEPVSGATIGEDEIDIPLREERAYVEKDVVAKERIGLEKDVETTHETVSEDVRKERVDVDEDVDRR